MIHAHSEIIKKKTYFKEKVLPKYKTKSKALKSYLKNIVIFQSTNKNNHNWNALRLSKIDLTLRQISKLTGLSISYIHKILKDMEKSGEIKVCGYKSSGTMQYKGIQIKKRSMIFYHFPKIMKGILKKQARKIHKQMLCSIKNTRNIYINIYKVYKQLYAHLAKDPLMHWCILNQKWYFKEKKYDESVKTPTISELIKMLEG